MSLNNNSTVTIRCPVLSGSYPKPRVVWRRLGKSVEVGESISLRLVNESHLGQITCIAYNGYGEAKLKQFNLVLEEDKPHALSTSPAAHSEMSDTIRVLSTPATDTSHAKLTSYSSATSVAVLFSTLFLIFKLRLSSGK